MQPASLEGYLELQWDGHYAESLMSFDARIAAPDVFTDDPETKIVDGELLETVNSVVDSVPAREAEIIRRRFGWNGEPPETLAAIGNRFAVTRERIRQLEKKSLEQLKELFEALSFFGEVSFRAQKSSTQATTRRHSRPRNG